MQELDKGLDVSMKGDVAQEALERFRQQLGEWGVTMPRQEPLIFDFGQGDFYRMGLIESWIANEVEAAYCGKYMFLFEGQTCPMHSHLTKHETIFVVRGKVLMDYDDHAQTMEAGATIAVEPKKFHEFTALAPSLLLEISKPCYLDDNFFVDRSIPYGANYQKSQREHEPTPHLLSKTKPNHAETSSDRRHH